MDPAVTAEMAARGRGLGSPRWSPDGRALAWIETVAGRADILAAPTDGSGPPSALTADIPAARSPAAFDWAPDGVTIVYASADGRLLAVPASGGPVRVLTRDGKASAPVTSPDGSRVAFALERDDACDIGVVALDGSGWPARVSTGADYALDPAWSPDGRWLAWHEWDLPNMPWDGSRIAARPLDGTAPAGPCLVVAGGDGISVGQPRFSPDGSVLGFTSDEGGFAGVRLVDVPLAGAKESRALLPDDHEHAEATWAPGQRSWCFAPDGAAVVLCRNEDGFGRLVRVELPGGDAKALARGWHHGLDWGAGGVAAIRSGARTPPSVTVTPASGGARRVLASAAPGALVAARPPEPEAVTWAGDDGATVHGLLYRPDASDLGENSEGPLLVAVHGGPTGSATANWAPAVAFWLSRGWSMLFPNYRGSTGYGRAYTQALTRNWGALDVADVAAGIRHAGRAGWGDPSRVALTGGSAGGLTLLLLAAHHPGLAKAGVCAFGVTDLFDLAETTHRYESRYLDMVVGPLPEAAAAYRERSPITHVERIAMPLLVLQGDKDDTVVKGQSDRLVEALRRRGTPVDYHVYEGEGHGWSRPETVADHLSRADAFLTRWVLKR